MYNIYTRHHGAIINVLIFFTILTNISHSKKFTHEKNLQSPSIHIYVAIYLGTRKYTYTISKNNLKIIKK